MNYEGNILGREGSIPDTDPELESLIRTIYRTGELREDIEKRRLGSPDTTRESSHEELYEGLATKEEIERSLRVAYEAPLPPVPSDKDLPVTEAASILAVSKNQETSQGQSSIPARLREWVGKELDKPAPAVFRQEGVETRKEAVVFAAKVGLEKSQKVGVKLHEELKKPAVQVGSTVMSRRGVLGGGLATALTGTSIGSLIEKEQKLPVEDPAPSFTEKILEKITSTRELEPQIYDMGELAGKGVGDLFCDYLGLEKGDKVPKKLKIDFVKAVGDLWERKVKKVSRDKPSWVDNTKRAKEIFGRLYESDRRKSELITLEDFIVKADSVVEDVNVSVNWGALSQIRGEVGFSHLAAEDINLVKKLSEKVTGTMLLGYSITELMPALRDPKRNVAVYRFLLEKAGTEFLRCIPAIYDVYVSAGLFQFTSFAVYDMGGNQKRGASITNMLLPKEKQIGGSVVSLRSDEEQIKAAQLFAIYNIAYLIEDIRNPKRKGYDPAVAAQRIKTLWEKVETLDVPLLEYIAAAHHLPGDARKAFRKFIDKGFAGSHSSLASEGISDYIRKSNDSYHELEAVLRAKKQA